MKKAICLFVSVFCLEIYFVFAQDGYWKESLEKQKIYNSLEIALKNPANVRRLHLNSVNFEQIPLSLFKLVYLEELVINIAPLKFIPKDISRLKNLKVLMIIYTDITDIPEEISELTNLRVLNLTGNKISNIPPHIRSLKNLEELILYDNQISDIPENMDGLERLKVLNLGANRSLNVDQALLAFSKCPVISILNLEGIEMFHLPVIIAEYKNLRELYVYNNNLETIPAEIDNLQNLEILNLGESRGAFNKISHLPESLSNLQKLRELYISNNNLTQIPECIFNLRSLEVLDLSYNQIREVPAEIGRLVNLRILNLSYNELKTLPKEISQLKNLRKLDRYSNQISDEEEIKIIRYLSRITFTAQDSLEVENNYASIKQVCYEYHEGSFPSAGHYKLSVTAGKIEFEDFNTNSQKEKEITTEEWEDIQKEAYWLAYKYYQGKNDPVPDDCAEGTYLKLTINNLIYESDGCYNPEFSEEISLILIKLKMLQ